MPINDRRSQGSVYQNLATRRSALESPRIREREKKSLWARAPGVQSREYATPCRRQLAAITARHGSPNARVCGEWKNGTGQKRSLRGRIGVSKAMRTPTLKISAAFLVATVAATGGRLLAQQALAPKPASPA